MNNAWIERDGNDSKIIIDEDNRCVNMLINVTRKLYSRKLVIPIKLSLNIILI